MDRRASSSSSGACRQRTRQKRFLLSVESTTSGCSPGFLSAVFLESVGDPGVLKRGGPLRRLNCTSTPDVYIPATAASVIRASANWQPKPVRRPRPAHWTTPNSAASSSSSSLSVQPRRRTNRQDAVLPIAINSTRETNVGERGIDAVAGLSIYEMTEEPSFKVPPKRHLHSFHGLGFRHGTLREDTHTNIEQAADRFRNWRLDVDSMSYEGHLNLGNKIGHVKTGLKEDGIHGCAEKTNKCTMVTDVCSICLEENCSLSKGITKLECGHEYHECCIKKWLQRKSICPICKGTVVHI